MICPHCKQRTVADEDGNCLSCGRPVRTVAGNGRPLGSAAAPKKQPKQHPEEVEIEVPAKVDEKQPEPEKSSTFKPEPYGENHPCFYDRRINCRCRADACVVHNCEHFHSDLPPIPQRPQSFMGRAASSYYRDNAELIRQYVQVFGDEGARLRWGAGKKAWKKHAVAKPNPLKPTDIPPVVAGRPEPTVITDEPPFPARPKPECGTCIVALQYQAYRQAVVDMASALVENRAKGFSMQLTERELEVAKLAGSGWDNEAIASKLVIDIKTVEHHLNSVFHKFKTTYDVSGRTLRVYLGAVLRGCEVEVGNG